MSENSQKKNQKPDWIQAVLMSSAIMALVFCLVFIARFQTLAANAEETFISIRKSVEVRVGDQLPDIEGMDMNEKPWKLDFNKNSSFRILQIVSMYCGGSGEQIKEWWPAISSDPRLQFAQPTLISLESPMETRTQWDPSIEMGNLVSFVSSKYRRACRIERVPVLLFVSPSGEVLWALKKIMETSDYENLIAETRPYDKESS